MRPATADELARWDELVASNPFGGNVLQCRAFAETKALHGWTPRYFNFHDIAVMVLTRRVPTFGELWYVPKGPAVTNIEGVKSFVAAVRELPAPRPFMIKIDPEIPASKISISEMTQLGFSVAPRDIQYNVSTVVVNLQPSEEELLTGFKQKTRYNVRLAAKKGVVAEAVDTNDATIDRFYDLAAATYRRAGVYVRSKRYFADFWRLHAQQGTGQMFFAKLEEEVLAAAFITYLGGKALYKDGASSREHTDVQAPYALQWEVMRWLKAKGVSQYDLHGVPPAAEIDNPKHPLAGLARFKTGFNQEITEFIGTYDLPLNASAYSRWRRYGERIAVAYEYRRKKRLFY